MNAATHQDRYGLPLSTNSAEAADAYRDGFDLMLAAWPGAAEAFERAIAADPDFALAHIARARIHTFYQQSAAARQQAALARQHVAHRGTAREQSHVETLALAVEGQIAAALNCALSHLEAWPRDAVVMSLPLGAVAKGRAMTERAFAMRRANAYAAHALLHAMFEDGSVADADALVTQWIGGYDRSGILYGHIYWHQALGALEIGDAAKALSIYADILDPPHNPAPPLNVMSDCAALL